jgi:hypothetical protein
MPRPLSGALEASELKGLSEKQLKSRLFQKTFAGEDFTVR